MWLRPRLVGAGWVQRAEARSRLRMAVLFALPWRHPFLRTGEDGIRPFKHFDTCEYDETSAKCNCPSANSPNSYSSRSRGTEMTSLINEAAAAVATPQVRSPRPLRSLIAGLVLAVAPLSVIGVAAPTAHADYAVDSSNFHGALSSRGITFASRQAATAAGREVCDELDQGMQASDVANNVMAQSDLDGYHAGFFVGVSIAAFCPRHSQ